MEVVDDFASIEDFEGFVYKTEPNFDESQQIENQAEHQMNQGTMILAQAAMKTEFSQSDVEFDPLNTSIDIKHEFGEDDQIVEEDEQIDMGMEDMEKCDFCEAYFLKGKNELITHFNEVHADEFHKMEANKNNKVASNKTKIVTSVTKPLKPNLNFVQLITQALYNAPYHQDTFEGIRESISQKFPYFQMSANKWQTDLSYHLATNAKFKKIEDSQLWTLDLSALQSKDDSLNEPSIEVQVDKEKHYEGPKKSKAIVIESTNTR